MESVSLWRRFHQTAIGDPFLAVCLRKCGDSLPVRLNLDVVPCYRGRWRLAFLGRVLLRFVTTMTHAVREAVSELRRSCPIFRATLE